MTFAGITSGIDLEGEGEEEKKKGVQSQFAASFYLAPTNIVCPPPIGYAREHIDEERKEGGGGRKRREKEKEKGASQVAYKLPPNL